MEVHRNVEPQLGSHFEGEKLNFPYELRIKKDVFHQTSHMNFALRKMYFIRYVYIPLLMCIYISLLSNLS
jgi:hypothetical protein